MLYAVTASQTREIEQTAIKEFKIPSLILMENAAMRTTAHARRFLCEANIEKHTRQARTAYNAGSHYKDNGKALVVCGIGNNGGDGYAIARQLHAEGINVSVIAMGKPGTEEAMINYGIVKNIGITVYNYVYQAFYNSSAVNADIGLPPMINGVDAKAARALIMDADVVVDALFGIGLTRRVTGEFLEMVEMINECAARVVSADVPSGLDSDTGQVLGEAVRADVTVTYGYIKTGLLLYPGAEYAGEVIAEGISVPPVKNNAFIKIITDGDVPALMPERKPDSNKGSHGRVCVIAGSAGMPGAAALACTAAYKIGAGLVDACVPPEAATAVHYLLPEAITTIIQPESNGWQKAVAAAVDKSKAVLLGPGLGQSEEARLLVRFVLERVSETNRPLVLDADGLNAAAAMGTDLLNNLPNCVITPHPGEMSRLTGLSVREILADPLETARSFSQKHGTTVLLKGARTVIAAPDGTAYINTSGCSALAKAGTGDVLAGIIAGLLAQAITERNADGNESCSMERSGRFIMDAAALGAFLHGRAGEKAAEKMTARGVLARDVIENIGVVYSV